MAIVAEKGIRVEEFPELNGLAPWRVKARHNNGLDITDMRMLYVYANELPTKFLPAVLGVRPDELEDRARTMRDKLHTNTDAQSVYQALGRGILPFEVTGDPLPAFTFREYKFLGAVAQGQSDIKLQETLSASHGEVMETSEAVFDKLHAETLAGAMRRGFETELFKPWGTVGTPELTVSYLSKLPLGEVPSAWMA